MDLSKTYWGSDGKYQNDVDKLHALIPSFGSVANPRRNRHLEKFRKASGCYYDLYNNGLGNRANEFRQVFGIASSHYMWRTRYGKDFGQDLVIKTEEAMDKLIELAMNEQGLALK